MDIQISPQATQPTHAPRVDGPDRDGQRLRSRDEEQGKIDEIVQLVDRNLESLLRHEYFEACRGGALDRPRLVVVLQQLYCFSRMYERLITRRLATFSSRTPADIVATARQHLRNELGHPLLFHRALVELGMSAAEIDRLAPATFITAMYAYLLVVIEHEDEGVASVAMLQVMESVGYRFYQTTLQVVRHLEEGQRAFVEHAEEDASHSRMGLASIALLDAQGMDDCRRIIGDLFRIIELAFDDFMRR